MTPEEYLLWTVMVIFSPTLYLFAIIVGLVLGNWTGGRR